jgi:hypothetical protein
VWRKVIFFVALPEPLRFPSGFILPFSLPEETSELEDMPMRSTPEGPPSPTEVEGHQFVSLRFWQAPYTGGRTADVMEALSAVLPQALPPAVHGRTANSQPPPAPESQITIVEMVTLASTDVETDWVTDAFDRCFSCLQDVARAYRIRDNVRPQLTRERLHPFALWTSQDMSEGAWDTGLSIFLITFNLPEVADSEPLQTDQSHEFIRFVSELRRGHPAFLCLERMADARTALQRDGDYGEAVVQAAIAVEVLLQSALAVVLWEQGMDPQQAGREVFTKPLARLVRGECAAHLGGGVRWQATSPGPVLDWDQDLARLRHRVVHTGYQPALEEARRALAAAEGMRTFVADRLVANASRSPRAALILVGPDGLERREAWTRRMRTFAEEQAPQEDDWLMSFQAWREEVDRAAAAARSGEDSSG